VSEAFEPAARPLRAPSVAWRVIQGEAVMVLPATGRVHTLNPVGTRFWELVDGQRTLGEIARQLHEEFDAPLGRIELDCQHFAAELGERRLLAT